MAKAKTIVSFFIFLFGFLIIGESNTFYLENFQDSYQQVGYYLEVGDSEEKMRDSIIEKSKEFDAPIFTMVKEDGGIYNRKIILYGDKTIWSKLKKDWGIVEGNHHSFFTGNTNFEFKDFSDAPVAKIYDYWYFASKEELEPMLRPGMVRYSGNFRNMPIGDISQRTTAGIWLIMIVLLLLLTSYDVLYSKKERAIEIILGSDPKYLFIKKLRKDIYSYTIALIASILILLPFTKPLFRWNISLIMYILFSILNGIFLFFGMKIKRVKISKMEKSTNAALKMSLIIKGVTTALTVIFLSTTIGLAIEGYNLYKQRDYYNIQGSYAHVKIEYPFDYSKVEQLDGSYEISPLTTDEQLIDNFMRYSYRELNCKILYYDDMSNIYPSWGDRKIMANKNVLPELKEKIQEIKNLSFEEGHYLFIPKGLNKDKIVGDLTDKSIFSIPEETIKGIVTYKGDAFLTVEGRKDFEYDYTYEIKNPVIILDNYDYGRFPLYTVSYGHKEPDIFNGIIGKKALYYMQFAKLIDNKDKIYEFGEKMSSEIINPNLVEYTITNVRTWYEGLWALQNRGLFISLILTILILLLEISISTITLVMDYEVNANELIIRKVLGYSKFERHRKMLIITSSICLFSLILAFVIHFKFNIGIISYMVYGSIIVYVLDIFILSILIHKIDKKQIQKILKGGI